MFDRKTRDLDERFYVGLPVEEAVAFAAEEGLESRVAHLDVPSDTPVLWFADLRNDRISFWVRGGMVERVDRG